MTDLITAIREAERQVKELRKVLPGTVDHRIKYEMDGDGNIVAFWVLPDTIMKRLEFE